MSDKKMGTMHDKIGTIPTITNSYQALKEILYVASDKRSHFMLADACDWLNLKMKVIRKLARKGLEKRKKK